MFVFKLYKRIFKTKLLVAVSLLAFIFLLAGGIGAFQAYANGAGSYTEYVNAMTFPFMAGFLFVGLLGAIKFYRERNSKSCLFGALIMLVAYICIEVLFQSVGGA